jgi:hypothetical protein
LSLPGAPNTRPVVDAAHPNGAAPRKPSLIRRHRLLALAIALLVAGACVLGAVALPSDGRHVSHPTANDVRDAQRTLSQQCGEPRGHYVGSSGSLLFFNSRLDSSGAWFIYDAQRHSVYCSTRIH